ncbi:hypothetical protein NC652_002348 [Populus alba x Populus x berolinensis]|nr:hypothetical protein NC652_002348 [Populus alba x Populus x berolinensis]
MTEVGIEKAIKMMLGMKAGGGEIGIAVIVKNGIVERQTDSFYYIFCCFFLLYFDFFVLMQV